MVGLADEVLTVQSVHLNDYSPDGSAHSINVQGLTDLKDISLSVDNKIVYVRGGASVVSVDLVSGELETVVEDLGAGDCSLVGTGQTEVRHATDAVLFTCGKQSVLIVNLDAPENRVVLQSNVSHNLYNYNLIKKIRKIHLKNHICRKCRKIL